MESFPTPQAVLFVVFSQVMVSPSSGVLPVPPPKEESVRSMCAATTCLEGNVCRVVKDCPWSSCTPRPTCVPCVTDGVDDICNARKYISAVLVHSPRRHVTFDPLYCVSSLRRSGCPEGSVCAPNQIPGRPGTCCFGKPELPVKEVKNSDPRCKSESLCGRPCRRGQICELRKKMSRCGSPSYKCMPIEHPGRCPPVPFPAPPRCQTVRVGFLCRADSECDRHQKCCPGECGGASCVAVLIKG